MGCNQTSKKKINNYIYNILENTEKLENEILALF